MNSESDKRSCPRCGAFKVENARFCVQCGTSLDNYPQITCVICSTCGTENPSYASFCMECGVDLKVTNRKTEEDGHFPDKMGSLELTPAESLLILDLDIEGKEVFKLAMLNLIDRRVMKIRTFQEDKGFLVKEPVLFHEVHRGENFEAPLLPYEEIFRKPLYSHNEIEIYRYVQMILKNINPIVTNSYSEYKEDYLINSLIKGGYIEKIGKKGLNSPKPYKLTQLGVDIRKKIVDILDDADNLGEWVDTDPKRAKAFLSALGSHIFLLNYDLDTLRFLTNNLTGIESRTAKYYSYYLSPIDFFKDFKSEQDIKYIFRINALESFEFFETFDPFDDIFDSFE
ncbi:MAG: zinc ribbon domain-containing protein [Euryarchaeota archaeon]|nr:zinc ribbon domain-containing protein [Euryarchaeota archaeon]